MLHMLIGSGLFINKLLQGNVGTILKSATTDYYNFDAFYDKLDEYEWINRMVF